MQDHEDQPRITHIVGVESDLEHDLDCMCRKNSLLTSLAIHSSAFGFNPQDLQQAQKLLYTLRAAIDVPPPLKGQGMPLLSFMLTAFRSCLCSQFGRSKTEICL